MSTTVDVHRADKQQQMADLREKLRQTGAAIESIEAELNFFDQLKTDLEVEQSYAEREAIESTKAFEDAESLYRDELHSYNQQAEQLCGRIDTWRNSRMLEVDLGELPEAVGQYHEDMLDKLSCLRMTAISVDHARSFAKCLLQRRMGAARHGLDARSDIELICQMTEPLYRLAGQLISQYENLHGELKDLLGAVDA